MSNAIARLVPQKHRNDTAKDQPKILITRPQTQEITDIEPLEPQIIIIERAIIRGAKKGARIAAKGAQIVAKPTSLIIASIVIGIGSTIIFIVVLIWKVTYSVVSEILHTARSPNPKKRPNPPTKHDNSTNIHIKGNLNMNNSSIHIHNH